MKTSAGLNPMLGRRLQWTVASRVLIAAVVRLGSIILVEEAFFDVLQITCTKYLDSVKKHSISDGIIAILLTMTKTLDFNVPKTITDMEISNI
jgi:hypothetical protein